MVGGRNYCLLLLAAAVEVLFFAANLRTMKYSFELTMRRTLRLSELTVRTSVCFWLLCPLLDAQLQFEGMYSFCCVSTLDYQLLSSFLFKTVCTIFIQPTQLVQLGFQRPNFQSPTIHTTKISMCSVSKHVIHSASLDCAELLQHLSKVGKDVNSLEENSGMATAHNSALRPRGQDFLNEDVQHCKGKDQKGCGLLRKMSVSGLMQTLCNSLARHKGAPKAQGPNEKTTAHDSTQYLESVYDSRSSRNIAAPAKQLVSMVSFEGDGTEFNADIQENISKQPENIVKTEMRAELSEMLHTPENIVTGASSTETQPLLLQTNRSETNLNNPVLLMVPHVIWKA